MFAVIDMRTSHDAVDGSDAPEDDSEGDAANDSGVGQLQDTARARAAVTDEADEADAAHNEEGDAMAGGDDGDENEEAASSARVNPATLASAPTPKPRPGSKTLVGGLLASNGTMKPFRSPVIRAPRPANPADTPTRPSTNSSSSATPRSAPASSSRTKTITSSRPITTSFRAPSVSALNKPFVSPVVRGSSAPSGGVSDASTLPESTMSSFQLANALFALERRLANLKNAKRYTTAMEKGAQTSDNTAHIRELSEKWLHAGREAADMLYALTKDQMDDEQSARGTSGNGRFGYDSPDDNRGKKRSGWGWDTLEKQTNAYTDNIKRQVEELSAEEREQLSRDMEAEDERDPLPADTAEILSRSSSKSSVSASGQSKAVTGKRTLSTSSRGSGSTMSAGDDASQERSSKFARIDEEEADAVDEPAEQEYQSEVEEEEEEPDAEAPENPGDRGMPKMLLQCGIP